jgi:hypothetical protein
MSKYSNLIGSARYKLAQNKDTNIQLDLEQKSKPLTEYNIIDIVNQYQVFLDERNNSKKYRINGKFNIYTSNVLSTGSTSYVNGKYDDSSWSPIFYGNPPLAPNNWVMQITYPSNQIFNYTINARTSLGTISTEAYRGLQYQALGTTVINTDNYLTVLGVQNHNLSEGDYIYISSSLSTNQLQGVYRVKNLGIEGENLQKNLTLDVIVDPLTLPIGFGNFFRVVEPSEADTNFYNSGTIVFATATDISGNTLGNYTVNDIRYTKIKTTQPHNLLLNDFVEIKVGSANILNGVWRVYNIIGSVTGSTEFIIRVNLNVPKGTNVIPAPNPQYRFFNGTPSEYYVRQFEVITTNDYSVYPCSFSSNIYPNVSDVTIGSVNDTWLFQFNEDVNIDGLSSDRNGPISELYYTVIKRAGKNPYGWSTVTADWDFNYGTTDTSNGIEFISIYNPNGIGSVEKLSGRTNFINSNGDIVAVPGSKYIGDFMEFNSKDLLERKCSDVIHRFGITPTPNNEGYYYKPFNRLEIRKYSNVIEYANPDEIIIDIPENYVTYADGSIAWRDLLTIGYFEEGVNGVDYPFLNGAHYFYFNHNLYVRRQKPPITLLGDKYIEPTTIPQEC